MNIRVLTLNSFYHINFRIIIDIWNEITIQIVLFVGTVPAAAPTVREHQLQKSHHKH